MLRSVREELDRIEKFLLNKDQGSEDLAAILSALRGPDNMSASDKTTYTAPIRHAAFPLLSETAAPIAGRRFACGAGGWQIGGLLPKEPEEASHFATHIREALKALTREEV